VNKKNTSEQDARQYQYIGNFIARLLGGFWEFGGDK